MRTTWRSIGLAVVGLSVWGTQLTAQTAPPPRPATQPTPAQPTAASTNNGVAAIVNGQPISETMVQRALKRVPPAEQARARAEIMEFLVDNVLIEQYLVQQKVVVDAKEVQARLTEIQSEMQKYKQDYNKMLQELSLTEEELKAQIAADLRWEKFAMSRSTDPVLQDMFTKNMDMFDGSMVRARHILINPASSDPKIIESTRANMLNIKKEILAAGDAALAKLPATTDPLTKEQTRTKAIEDAFARAAEKYSACPSKKEGGDISWFPRAGSMVEPFAKAAFALKPYEVSDVVVSPFGMHLILAIGRKPGQPVSFDQVKDEVREVYCGQLRDQLCAHLRQSAKVTVK
jgi:peptidyl-prolyl cis-trans isomerase C